MVFVLKGTAGPYKDKMFKLSPGMTVGRRRGDILLDQDSAVSSLHGRVIGTAGGGLAIQDAGSQNQFSLFGKKVAHIDLAAGVVFQIGQTTFQVMAFMEKDLATLPIERNWKEALFEALEGNASMDMGSAAALNPVVTIECLQGPSAENCWFLGFGPRLFGPLSPDIEFLEKDSPDIAFEISQGPYGPFVKSVSQSLTINKQNLSEKILEDGDLIQVGSSVFKVQLGI